MQVVEAVKRFERELEILDHTNVMPVEGRGTRLSDGVALSVPQPAKAMSSCARIADERRDPCLELGCPPRALAKRADQVAADPHPSSLLGASELAGDPLEPDGAIEAARRQLELGPEVVEVPAQAALLSTVAPVASRCP